MTLESDYKKTQKISKPFLKGILLFLIEMWRSVKKRFQELYSLLKLFWKDIGSGNFIHKLSAIISVIIVLFIFVYLPGKSIWDWGHWNLRELSIKYTEYPPIIYSEVENEIRKFSNEYTKAYGTNCEWFRGRDVDIEMWENYKRLRRDSYPCINFNKTSNIELFPIRVGDIKRGELIETVDVLFGKVEYDDGGAQRYSTINSKLWKILDDPIWRIDRMNNAQKCEMK